MQQQFKGSEKSIQSEQKQTNEKSTNLMKQLLNPSRIIQPSITLITKLKQIEESTKAYYYYLQRLKRKSFNQLYYEDYQFQFALLEKVFYKFKLARLETKINTTQIFSFFNRLKIRKQHSKQSKQRTKKAQNHRNTNLTKLIFNQWIQLVKITKKQKIVQNIIKRHRQDEFINLFIERKHKNIRKQQNQYRTHQIIIKIYQSSLLKKYFQIILFHNKIIKLQRTKIKRNLQKLLIKYQEDKRQTSQLINKFKLQQTTRLKRQVLQSLQSNKIQKQCEQWYKYQLTRSFFHKWKQYLNQKKDQKQIQTSNEIILRHFLQNKSKSNKILTNHFNYWKSWTFIEKNRKKQQNILQSFASLKQKQILERKYFLKLKIYKNHQKARKFYQLHIKANVLQAFKLNILKQSHKLQNFFKFVQNKNIKKYFERIKIYNLIEKQKLKAFLLKKYWIKFTLTIAMLYFEKTQKAREYHNILLKFKSILTLKKNVQFQRKVCFFAYQLNILKSLKRWYARFKIRKFIKFKQLIILKKILFQWKLQTIRKNNTSHDKSNPIYSQPQNSMQSHLNQIGQTSFFKKLSSNQSDDEIQTRVNQVLKKINKQRTKQKINSKKLLESEMIRLPTWSTPGNDYNVSVFHQE